MFGGGRLPRPRFVSFTLDLDRSHTRRDARMLSCFPSPGFRPARSLAPFAPSISAITYRRVITARALSRSSPGSIHTIEMTVRTWFGKLNIFLLQDVQWRTYQDAILVNSSYTIAIFQSPCENCYAASCKVM